MSPLVEEAPGSLTTLTEDERLFRDAVRDFAETEIAPKVRQMDEAGRIDPELISQLFELGVMGVEIPESRGGLGSTFFTSIIVVEELSRIDPAVAVLVDVQNTMV
ncbi:MAG: acyl-CoA dehydrogenase family protein, partial [Gemmatimonadota bacterium]